MNIQTLFLYFSIQMPAVLLNEAEHTVVLLPGYLFKYGLIPHAEPVVQLLVNMKYGSALLRQPEINLFLVLRLLIAFD